MQIAVGVLYREPVPDADNGALVGRVEQLDGVCVCGSGVMRIAANIFPCGMVDPEMRREFAADPAIGRQRVGAKNNASADALDNPSYG